MDSASVEVTSNGVAAPTPTPTMRSRTTSATGRLLPRPFVSSHTLNGDLLHSLNQPSHNTTDASLATPNGNSDGGSVTHVSKLVGAFEVKGGSNGTAPPPPPPPLPRSASGSVVVPSSPSSASRARTN